MGNGGHEGGRAGPRGQKRILVIGLLLVVAVLVGFAAAILRTADDTKQSLDTRFASRAELTALFTSDYLEDVATREQAQAERAFAHAEVTADEFDEVVESFGFPAAVLLDDAGLLEQVYPAKPSILGTDMSTQYEHLRTALGGKVGVSEVVPSAAEGVPITAVAVPFEAEVGRRVFSGAFEPEKTPLGSFFTSVVPTYGGNAFLVDDHGHLIVQGGGAVEPIDDLLQAPIGLSHLHVGGEPVTVSVVQVEGAPWRTILVGQSDGLYAAVAEGQTAPRLLWLTLAAVLLALLVLVVWLNRARSEAADAARTDELTGLPNRRSMLEVLERQVHQTVRAGSEMVVLLLDVDHFKTVNDENGHSAGDEALRLVGAAIRSVLRKGDLLGRWGGEEFLVVLAPTTPDGAEDAADRIRASVEGTTMPFLESGGCTVSIGLARVAGGDVDAALSAADTALYLAKDRGRNRVEVATT